METMNFEKYIVPEELIGLCRWVCWRLVERDGKLTKEPINPVTGGRAMSNNPATWGTYQDAVKAYKAEGYNGIGFMFGDGIVGVDLDHCVDEEGNLTPEARDIIHILDSYTEYSQSGNGIHIICYGKMPEGRKRKSNVEMYASGRFFIMTGNSLDDGHTEIEDRTEELAEVHRKYLADKPKEKIAPAAVPVTYCNSEAEVLERMQRSKKWGKIQQLLNGDHTGYTSASEAELALMNDLYYFSNGDSGIMESIFKKSAFYSREAHQKNPHKLRLTLDTAVNTSLGRTYSSDLEHRKSCKPSKSAKKEVAAHEDPEGDASFNALVEQAGLNTKLKHVTADDLGRSRRYSQKHKNLLRWCEDMKSWLIWDEKHWKKDNVLQTIQFAKCLTDELLDEAYGELRAATTDNQRAVAEKKLKEVSKSRSDKAIRAMVDLAKSDLPIMMDQLDHDPFLLNCQNGIVDLRTGQLQEHKPEFYLTKITNANFNPEKKFTKFHMFLKDVTCEDAELAEYFQIVCGMAAIGKVFHEGLCIFYGAGRNGKSTFLNCISKVLGDYSGSLDPEVLMAQKNGKQAFGLADVKGKRFVTSIETEEGRRISSAVLKQLSSTDEITARRLYENNSTFKPSHTLILATNHLPKVGSTDTGTWRRIAVVPFRAKFEGKKRN